MDFYSAYAQGFARVAACAVPVRVADPAANAAATIAAARECHDDAVAVAVFPEMGLTGYAIDDLVLADPLLDAARTALDDVVAASVDLLSVLVVGAPLAHGNRVLNAAVVIHRGRVLGVAPKAYLPTYREFYDRRYFGAGDAVHGTTTVAGQEVPIGPDLLFEATDVPGLVLHVEVCEDLWVPVPPSATAALAGATVLANLSGSPITVGRADDRRLLCASASLRCLAAHVYAAAGQGESSTDLSWDGQTMVHELGETLAESERFAVLDSGPGGVRTVADVDLDRIRLERLRTGTLDDNRRTVLGERQDGPEAHRRVTFELAPPAGDVGLRRKVDRFPFVPDDADRLAQDCYEAYHVQVTALAQRLRAIGDPKVVIGVSGGLDSTHALIVAARAMDLLGRPRSDVLAFTLPGFATSDATRTAAVALMDALGATAETIDIRPMAERMLADLGHPYSAGERGREVYDVTFENVQAGLRTDLLFRLANQRGGIVLGTGDLSELALGWCTYGVGDQMSHYAVNTGVPKTLIQHLLRWVVDDGQLDPATDRVVLDVLDAEISPELVPAEDGAGPQSTEDAVGPYALADLALFHVLRYGRRPSRIAFLAWHAWHDADAGEWPPGFPDAKRVAYDLPTIKHWLEEFVRRFFASQFKRSALPNGPKVTAGGALSPRGDWRMPSDASADAWLADLENVPEA